MRLSLFLLAIAIPTTLLGQNEFPDDIIGPLEKYFTNRTFQTMADNKTDNVRMYQFDYDANISVITDRVKGKGIHWITVYGTTDLEEVNQFAWYCINRGLKSAYKSYFEYLKADFKSYQNGKLRSHRIIRGKDYKYAQVWNDKGEEILVNGNGTNSYLTDDKETFYEIYEDSVLTARYFIRPVTKDTVFHFISGEPATPKGGFEAFAFNIAQVVTYPEKARSKNKEGVFYINFIVDKDGKLTAFELVDKEGSLNLENNTIKSLMELPPWNPAIYKNKPVKQAFTLPLRFKLE